MKVFLRDMKNSKFDVEVADDSTILNLKEKLSELKETPVDKIRLLFKSKVLTNDAKISDLENSEANRIVFFAQNKPAPAQETKPAEPAPAKASETLPSEVTEAPPFLPDEDQYEKEPSTLDSSISTKNLNESAIAQLMELGYPREKCEFALSRAQGNTEVAAELLVEGIDSDEKLGQYHSIPYDIVLNQVLSNPRQLVTTINNGGLVRVSFPDGRQSTLQINVNELIQIATERGLLQGYGMSQPQIDLTEDERQMAQQINGTYAGLSESQKRMLQELSKTFGTELSEVLQIYEACDRDEVKTRELLEGMV